MEKELKDKLIEVLKDLVRLDTFLKNGIYSKRGMIEDPIKALEDILFSESIRDANKDLDADNIDEMQDEITSKSIVIDQLRESLNSCRGKILDKNEIINKKDLIINDLEYKIRGFEA